MRKLQFTAQHGQQQDVNESGVVQKQVQDLLVQKLGQFGFETLPQSGDQVAVSVDIILCHCLLRAKVMTAKEIWCAK